MEIIDKADFRCVQCGESYSEKWKKLGRNLYACVRCGLAKTILLNDEQDEESLRELELDEAIRKEVIPRLEELEFKSVERFLTGLRAEFPDSPKVYFFSALADNSVCYTQDDIDPEKYIPTLNDIRGSSIFKNPNVIKCLELSHGAEREHYQETFDYIEKKRTEIKSEFSSGKYHYDVFISCKVTEVDPATMKPVLDGRGNPQKTRESELAREVCHKLWRRGIENVFYSEEEKEKMAGKRFENVIFSALHQAKVLILVANSRFNIDWRWVRNEWKRFLNVMNEASDGVERKFILYTEKLAVNEIPRDLKRFQIVNRQEVGADNTLFAAVEDAVKSSIVYSGTKVTASKVEAKKVETVAIVKGQRFDSKISLSTSEESEFELALSDMKIDDAKHFKAALRKLTNLANNNKTNFAVNWAMVQCLFEVNDNKALAENDLTFIAKRKDFPRLNEFLTNALGSADSDSSIKKVYDAMKPVFVNTLKRGHFGLMVEMCSPGGIPDIYSTFIGFLKQDKMMDLANAMLSCINESIVKGKLPFTESEFDILVKSLVVRIFSNAGDALEQLLGLYSKLAISFLTSEHYEQAAKCYNAMLEYDAYNSFGLWGRFMATIKLDDPDFLSTRLKSENFVNYDISNDNAPERKPNNLYSTIVDILKGGYEITNANGNFFSICLNAARGALLLKRDKIALPMYKALIDLAVGQYGEKRLSQEYIRDLCLTSGDLMCITEHFDEASDLFGIVAGQIDQTCPEAYWGLAKASLKIRTNYGAYLYKGMLTDNEFFRSASKHASDQGDKTYANFYAKIEKYKSDRTISRTAKEAFAIHQQKDIASGKSTPIAKINKILASENTAREFLFSEVKRHKQAKHQPKSAQGAKGSKKIIAHSLSLLVTLFAPIALYLFSTQSFFSLRFIVNESAFFISLPIAPIAGIGLMILLRILFNRKSPLADYGSPFSRAILIIEEIIAVAFFLFTFLFGSRIVPDLIYESNYAEIFTWAEHTDLKESWALHHLAKSIVIAASLTLSIILNSFCRRVTTRNMMRPLFYMCLAMIAHSVFRTPDFAPQVGFAMILPYIFISVLMLFFAIFPNIRDRKRHR